MIKINEVNDKIIELLSEKLSYFYIEKFNIINDFQMINGRFIMASPNGDARFFIEVINGQVIYNPELSRPKSIDLMEEFKEYLISSP